PGPAANSWLFGAESTTWNPGRGRASRPASPPAVSCASSWKPDGEPAAVTVGCPWRYSSCLSFNGEEIMNLSWVRQLVGRNPSGSRTRSRRASPSRVQRVRLCAEQLEDRITPTLTGNVLWIGPTGGLWSTAANWIDVTTMVNHVP